MGFQGPFKKRSVCFVLFCCVLLSLPAWGQLLQLRAYLEVSPTLLNGFQVSVHATNCMFVLTIPTFVVQSPTKGSDFLESRAWGTLRVGLQLWVWRAHKWVKWAVPCSVESCCMCTAWGFNTYVFLVPLRPSVLLEE